MSKPGLARIRLEAAPTVPHLDRRNLVTGRSVLEKASLTFALFHNYRLRNRPKSKAHQYHCCQVRTTRWQIVKSPACAHRVEIGLADHYVLQQLGCPVPSPPHAVLKAPPTTLWGLETSRRPTQDHQPCYVRHSSASTTRDDKVGSGTNQFTIGLLDADRP